MTTSGVVPARDIVRRAARALADGGVDSPDAEAANLVAHVAGVDRRRLVVADGLTADEVTAVDDLVRRRIADRTPLQYLVGTAVSGRLDLAVGPGVFVPRPETELLVEAALRALPPALGGSRPVVVDLCAGSGTLALEIAHARPDAEVHAVELHEGALRWLRRNADARSAAGDAPVRIHHADATDPGLLPELDGRVDVVVSNPPYIPDGTELPPEVARHEPASALFGGPDGLSVIRPLVVVAARLLREGGLFAVEHDDEGGAGVAAVVRSGCAFGTVERHIDLAGRERFVTAVRTAGTGPGAQAGREGAR